MCVRPAVSPTQGCMMHNDNTTPSDKLKGGSQSCLGDRRVCAATALEDQMAAGV